MRARSHPMSRGCSRSGSTLIVVIGLSSLLMCLIAAVSFRVRGTLINVRDFERVIQSHIMLQSSKLYIQGRSNGGGLGAGVSVTGGDQLDLPAKGKPLGSRLGWFHIKPEANNPSSNFDIIATGGSAGDGGLKSGGGAISAGDPVRNAYELRCHYSITFDSAAVAGQRFTIRQLDVLPNSLYPW